MSTHQRRFSRWSHTGPSPSRACAGTTSSAAVTDIRNTPLWTDSGGLPAVPALGEEVEVDVLARMLGSRVEVQRHAETGTLWQGEVSVDNLRVPGRDLLDVRV